MWFPRERSEPCTVRSSERFAHKEDPALSGHHRSLPLYCVIGADALSRAGNAMTTIAIPLIVLNQGYSAAEVGLSSAAASLPIVIGALAGGSFADRIGYRTTSVISDAASGVTVLVLGLLAQLHMLPL